MTPAACRFRMRRSAWITRSTRLLKVAAGSDGGALFWNGTFANGEKRALRTDIDDAEFFESLPRR